MTAHAPLTADELGLAYELLARHVHSLIGNGLEVEYHAVQAVSAHLHAWYLAAKYPGVTA